jgi:hypothetical protein
MVVAGSPHDPGMQIADRILNDFGGGGRLAAALKDARGPVQQRRLPLMDHRRMDLMSGRQFRTLRSPFSASDATRALKAASCFLRFDMS